MDALPLRKEKVQQNFPFDEKILGGDFLLQTWYDALNYIIHVNTNIRKAIQRKKIVKNFG